MSHKYTFFLGLCLILSNLVWTQTTLSLAIENCNTFKVEILNPFQSASNNVEKSYLLEVEILKDVWAKVGTVQSKHNAVFFENQKTNGRYRASLINIKNMVAHSVDSKSLNSGIQYSNSIDFNTDLACNPVINLVDSDQVETLNFNLYPNPIQSILFIEIYNLEIGAQGEIRDITGRKVMDFNIQNGRNMVNVDQLSNGVYFLVVKNSEKHSDIKKIFVNNSKF